MPTFHFRVPAPLIQLPGNKVEHGPGTWVPVGDQDRVHDFWLWSGPAQAAGDHVWGDPVDASPL